MMENDNMTMDMENTSIDTGAVVPVEEDVTPEVQETANSGLGDTLVKVGIAAAAGGAVWAWNKGMNMLKAHKAAKAERDAIQNEVNEAAFAANPELKEKYDKIHAKPEKAKKEKKSFFKKKVDEEPEEVPDESVEVVEEEKPQPKTKKK